MLNTARTIPTRRKLIFALVLLAALVLLVLTGLGVFRLYFGFDWTAGDNASGQIFSLKIRGGNSFDPFQAEPFGGLFWSTLAVLVALALALPQVRAMAASALAIVATFLIVLLHYRFAPAVPSVPVEFLLLIVVVLYAIHMAMSYIVEVRDRKRFASLLSQYVPPELAAAFSRDPLSMGLAGEEREVSVLFCDVVGFSAISERLESSQVAEWLNGFFGLTSRIVVRYRGTIDKYMGDSIMAVWGAPARSETHAFDALGAAIDISREIEELNEEYRRKGWPVVELGVGISTGRANVGPLGSEYRMDYTVVGDTVNVAQRLEAQTRKYRVPVIVSGTTAAAIPDMLFRELDTVKVKGRTQPVTMHEPLGMADAADKELIERLNLHREAMAASKSGDWVRARSLFTQLRDGWGPTDMYELYLRGIDRAAGA